MKEDRQYNGWTNYETWCVNLWLGNDEGSYSYWDDIASDLAEKYDDKNEAVGKLSEMLKAEVMDGTPIDSGMYADLLNAAISECNWWEIAEGMLETHYEEKEA